MPLFSCWKDEAGTFAIWKTEESNEALRASLKGAFPYDADLSRLKAESRRSEYLAVRVLLAEVCGEEKEICHEPSGKPFLADGSFRLSISHTRDYVAVALHPEREVGIDIEQVSERALKVADRFMCGEELAGQAEALKGCPEEAEQAALYYVLLHWSAKETLYKLMGEEEVDFSRHLRILPFRLRPEGRFSGCECRTRQGMRYEIRYMLHPDFVCTWSMGL
ncbi:4'-phosphopantetheinyl transferase family protein [Phocaeicola salanitronis]|uniref:4'-phosphopantetheinyl transferase family protein n=1 Tax=Phocaeicola salanitronis TaxID=376805 RepID=UPI003207B119